MAEIAPAILDVGLLRGAATRSKQATTRVLVKFHMCLVVNTTQRGCTTVQPYTEAIRVCEKNCLFDKTISIL